MPPPVPYESAFCLFLFSRIKVVFNARDSWRRGRQLQTHVDNEFMQAMNNGIAAGNTTSRLKLEIGYPISGNYMNMQFDFPRLLLHHGEYSFVCFMILKPIECFHQRKNHDYIQSIKFNGLDSSGVMSGVRTVNTYFNSVAFDLNYITSFAALNVQQLRTNNISIKVQNKFLPDVIYGANIEIAIVVYRPGNVFLKHGFVLHSQNIVTSDYISTNSANISGRAWLYSGSGNCYEKVDSYRPSISNTETIGPLFHTGKLNVGVLAPNRYNIRFHVSYMPRGMFLEPDEQNALTLTLHSGRSSRPIKIAIVYDSQVISINRNGRSTKLDNALYLAKYIAIVDRPVDAITIEFQGHESSENKMSGPFNFYLAIEPADLKDHRTDLDDDFDVIEIDE